MIKTFIHIKRIRRSLALVLLCSAFIFCIFSVKSIVSADDNEVGPNLVSFTSTTTNGTYGTGAVINITATFDTDIDPSANPTMQVVLDGGGTADLTSVSGATLSGTYTVVPGQNSVDLTVSSINSASNIQDTTMTPTLGVTYTIVPSAPNNIADASNIIIDTSVPTLTSFTSTTSNNSYGIDSNINITANFDKDLNAGSIMTVVLDTGASVTLDQISGSTLSGTYTIQASQNSSDLTVSSIDSSSVSDLFSNNSTSYSVPSAPNNIADSSDIVIDGNIPTLTTATVKGTTLTLTYNEDLDTGSVATTSDFIVNVNGSVVSVSSVNVIGTTTVLTLATSPADGDTVTVDYALGVNPIRDVAGNNASALSGQSVTNHTDTIAPVLNDATVYGVVLTLNYNEALNANSTPSTADFVVNVNGSPKTVSNVRVTDSNSVVLILAADPGANKDVTVDYTVPGSGKIQDLTGNNAESFSGQVVTNNDSCTAIPVMNTYYTMTVGTKVYVINASSNSISVIDTNTDSVVATILGLIGPQYGSVVGSKIYVGNNTSSTVSVIDTNTDTIVDTINSDVGPEGSAFVGKKLYSNNAGPSPGTVSVIDTTNNNVLSTITVGSQPLFSYTVGNKVYVNNVDSNNVSVIDSATDAVIATLSVGNRPNSSSVAGSKIYVGNYNSNTVSVINTNSNSVVATIPVGLNPQMGAVVGNKVYVNNFGSTTVSVINTNSNSVVSTISVGHNPRHSVVVGTKVYVGNLVSNTVSVIDSATDTVVATIPVGSHPSEMSVVGNKIYVNNDNSSSVSVIDTSTDTVVNICAPHLTTITSTTSNSAYTPGQSINLTATFNQALGAGSKMRLTLNTGAVVNLTTVSGFTLTGTYVVTGGETTPDLSVSSISSNPSFTSVSDTAGTPNTATILSVPTSPDLTGDSSHNLGDLKNIVVGTTTPITISVGTNPYQMATIGTLVYVADQGSDNVKVINTTNNTVTATITVGSQPYGVVYNTGTKELYVANLKGNTVSVIDVDPTNISTFNTVTHTINVGVEPYYVTSLGTNIYVTNSLSWTVSVINTATHTVTNTVNVGVNPRALKPHGTDIYVANFGSNYAGPAQGTVSVIDTASTTPNVTQTINVGSGARGVAVNGNEVYVANFNDGTVSVIDTNTNTVTNTITVGNHPRGMLSLGSNIYVENYQDGTISVIATGSHTVTGTYKVGNTPAAMTVAPNGTDIYVSRFTDGVVDMFDTTTLALKSSGVTDTTPPTISNVASSTSDTAASITWDTNDEISDSLVEYGTSPAYTASSTYDSTLSLMHSVSLTGLTVSTLYHYRVISVDGQGNLGSSSDKTFTTTAVPDTTAPTIVSFTSASSSARYGIGQDVGIAANFDEALDASSTMTVTLDTGVSVVLDQVSGSSISGTYTVGSGENSSDLTVNSIDSASVTDQFSNNSTSYSVPSTPDNLGDTSNIVIDSIAPTITTEEIDSTLLTLTYDESLDTGSIPTPADFVVNVNSTPVTVASVNVTGSTVVLTLNNPVIPNDAVTIDYTPGSDPIRDVVTNNASSLSGQNVTNITTYDTTPPVISNVASSTTLTTATVTWTTDESATSTVNYGTTITYDSASTSDSFVTLHSISLSGLSLGTLYHYQVSSSDVSGNVSTSSDMTFTTATPDTTPPVISSVASGSLSTTGATITWTTDESTDSLVEYGTSDTYTSSSTYSSTLATSHSVTLSSLSPSTTYHYRVISVDGSTNLATSTDNTFTTSAVVDTGGGGGGGGGGGSSGGGGGGGGGGAPGIIYGNGAGFGTTAGCAGGSLYSTATGLKCPVAVADAGCNGLNVYSTTTGLKCTASTVVTCLTGQIFNIQTGQKCTAFSNGDSVGSISQGTGGQGSGGSFTFIKNLIQGDRSIDVKYLQVFLNNHGFKIAFTGVGSPGFETTFFGAKTTAALALFQKSKGIIPASGFFGPKTRGIVNSMSGGGLGSYIPIVTKPAPITVLPKPLPVVTKVIPNNASVGPSLEAPVLPKPVVTPVLIPVKTPTIIPATISATPTTTSVILPKVLPNPIAKPTTDAYSKDLCSTTLYFNHSIKLGQLTNSSHDVTLLQNFLNSYESENLAVTGIYTKTDYDSVVRFQSKYASTFTTAQLGFVDTTTLNIIKKIVEGWCGQL